MVVQHARWPKVRQTRKLAIQEYVQYHNHSILLLELIHGYVPRVLQVFVRSLLGEVVVGATIPVVLVVVYRSKMT